MALLSHVLTPQRFLWMVHKEKDNFEKRMEIIGRALTDSAQCSKEYTQEILHAYSTWWLEQNKCPEHYDSSKFVFTSVTYVSASSPGFDPLCMRRLCSEIVHCPVNWDTLRLLAYFVINKFRDSPELVAECRPKCKKTSDAANIFQKLVTQYAEECTFKTHGDTIVHADILIHELPAWITCIMPLHSMPYSLLSKTKPDLVNSIVRPKLSESATQKLDNVAWQDPQNRSYGFIVIACLTLEIIASANIKLLVNSEVWQKHDMACPLPCVWRCEAGRFHIGYKICNVVKEMDGSVTAAEACLEWLLCCHHENIAELKNITMLLFETDDYTTKNPLKKYIL